MANQSTGWPEKTAELRGLDLGIAPRTNFRSRAFPVSLSLERPFVFCTHDRASISVSFRGSHSGPLRLFSAGEPLD